MIVASELISYGYVATKVFTNFLVPGYSHATGEFDTEYHILV